jgi:hypothetical protein
VITIGLDILVRQHQQGKDIGVFSKTPGQAVGLSQTPRQWLPMVKRAGTQS